MERTETTKDYIIEIIKLCSVSAFYNFFSPITKTVHFFKKLFSIPEDIISLKKDLLQLEKKLGKQQLDIFKKTASTSEDVAYLRDDLLHLEQKVEYIFLKEINSYNDILPLSEKDKITNKWNTSLKKHTDSEKCHCTLFQIGNCSENCKICSN